MLFHIFVHQALQIDVQLAVGTNDHIGAHADVWGHIAVGVIDCNVTAIVAHSVGGAFDGGFNQLSGLACRSGARVDVGADEEGGQYKK